MSRTGCVSVVKSHLYLQGALVASAMSVTTANTDARVLVEMELML